MTCRKGRKLARTLTEVSAGRSPGSESFWSFWPASCSCPEEKPVRYQLGRKGTRGRRQVMSDPRSFTRLTFQYTDKEYLSPAFTRKRGSYSPKANPSVLFKGMNLWLGPLPARSCLPRLICLCALLPRCKVPRNTH